MSRVKILYVDDEEINLFLFEENMKSTFDVVIARSAKQGLALLNLDPQISLVISDMRMPEMDGLEFIEFASHDFDLPYIILTGYSISAEIKDAIDRGLVETCLCKPYENDQLIETIKACLNN